MWFLCQEPCKTLDQARKRAMEIGRENFDSIHKERCGLFFKRTVYVVLWWRWIEKGEEKQMIDLANKCVLVITHEEYENILKAAKKQGYRWYGGKEAYPYPFEEQQIPDILKFYSNKELTRNASLTLGYELVEASDVIEDEKKIKDAINLVRAFAKNPDRTALTDSFIESLKLLADNVESQMEEVKQMERLTKWEDGSITYNEKRELECGEYCDSCSQGAGNCKTVENMIKKLATYEDLEEQGLLVRLPCPIGTTVWDICGMDIRENVVSGLEYDKGGKWFLWANEDECLGELNVLVFLNREEAENKLEELKNEI